MTPAPSADPGKLSVNCTPWCHIYLDDQDSGRNSPALGMEVRAGKHRLKVVNPPTGLSREMVIDVAPGETVKQMIRLQD